MTAGSLDWSGIESLLPGLSRRNGEIEQRGELPADVVTACYRAGGTIAMAAGHPLSRGLRDASMVTQHYAVSSATLAQLGGAPLGLDRPEPY